MKTMLTVALAAFFIAGCAQTMPHTAVAPSMCQPDMQWAEWRDKMHLDDAKAASPDQYRKFMSAFNAIEPVSAFNPDRLYLLKNNNHPKVLALFVDGPCVAYAFEMTYSAYESLMAGPKDTPGRGA